MAYDPMQYAAARANVIGRTAEGIGNAITTAAAKIPEIIKQKNIGEKVKTAYSTAVNSFADEAMKYNPKLTKAQAAMEAVRFIPAPIEGMKPEDNLRSLFSGVEKADKYLSELKGRFETQEATTGVRRVIAGRSTYSPAETGPESQVPVGQPTPMGETPQTQGSFTESDITGGAAVTGTEEPAQYRDQALSRYGKLASGGEVPYRTSEQLLSDPQIAGLQERPDPYKAAELKLKEKENERKRIESSKDDTAEFNKNLRWIHDNGIDLMGDKNRYNNQASLIQKAIASLQKNEQLDPAVFAGLKDAGIDAGDMSSIDRMKQHYSRAKSMIMQVDQEIKANKKTESYYAQGGTLPIAGAIVKGTAEAQKEAQATRDEKLKVGLNLIRTTLSPTLVARSSVADILNQLPADIQDVIREKVDESLAEGYSESDVKRILSGR